MHRSSILLIGDSITAGFNPDRFIPGLPILNKGVSGDSSVECLDRISPEWFRQPVNKIFICIGTNDLVRSRTDDEILENIEKIVGKVCSYSEVSAVYLTTLFPTRNNDPRPNDRIRAFNRRLEQLSKDLDCSFFDLHASFADEHGNLRAEFTDDGLHLTDSAYSKWAQTLKAFLEKTENSGTINLEVEKNI